MQMMKESLDTLKKPPLWLAKFPWFYTFFPIAENIPAYEEKNPLICLGQPKYRCLLPQPYGEITK